MTLKEIVTLPSEAKFVHAIAELYIIESQQMM